MSNEPLAFILCEASPMRGAGHAIRCSVLADALLSIGWKCTFVTTAETYEFIPSLSRFDCINPDVFYKHPINCDLLIFDNYDLDASYEKHFRPYVKKILVIDDLANRPHDCDVLVDQTYGRKPEDYSSLVPDMCEILTGSDYALLSPDFIKIRPQALVKRENTSEIKRILISMGGSDPNNYTIKVLKMIQEAGFEGTIDVVLGFTAPHLKEVREFAGTLLNQVIFHKNPNMAQLIYDADLAVGASGTSIWERCCLGLPSFNIIVADNQKLIYDTLLACKYILTENEFYSCLKGTKIDGSFMKIVDGFGINRLLFNLIHKKHFQDISLKPVRQEDKEMIWNWQSIKEVRQYFNNPQVPTREEHEAWFACRLQQFGNPFWLIYWGKEPVGSISLTYNMHHKAYDLSWYILPSYQGVGLGTKSLQMAALLVAPHSIRAEVKKDNLASYTALKKAGFLSIDHNTHIYTKVA